MFTPSDPPGIFINHLKYYDERILIFFLLAGCALIAYGLLFFGLDLNRDNSGAGE